MKAVWGNEKVEARPQTPYLLVSSPIVVAELRYLLSERVARRAAPLERRNQLNDPLAERLISVRRWERHRPSSVLDTGRPTPIGPREKERLHGCVISR
jgi:hypothetical protein